MMICNNHVVYSQECFNPNKLYIITSKLHDVNNTPEFLALNRYFRFDKKIVKDCKIFNKKNKLDNEVTIEIAKLHYVPETNELVSVLKTFWIRIFQRIVKKKLNVSKK